MKPTKKKKIYQMELQDDQGISRKKVKKVVKIKTLKLLKLIGILLIPLTYFVYSKLLLPVLFAYGVLLFISRSIERATNKNLKKEYRISLPAFDSVLALVILAVTVVSVGLSMVNTAGRGSMFDGKTDEEIRAEMEEKGIDDDRIDKILDNANGGIFNGREGNREITNALTLLSGERFFFSEVARFGGDVARPSMPMGEMPEGGFTPNDMGGRGAMDLAGNIPFEMIFNNLASSLNSALIFFVSGFGLLTLVMMRKIKD